jgi:hypothetical protein
MSTESTATNGPAIAPTTDDGCAVATAAAMGGGPGGPSGNQGGMMMMPQQQQQPFHGIKKGKALKRKISGQMMMQPQHHGFEGNGDGNQFMSPNYYYGPPGVNDHRINSSKRSSNNSTNNKIY